MAEHARVAIIGVGQARHARRRDDVDYAELALEAIDEALADAGVDFAELEHAVTGASDFLDGRTIASMSTAEVVGSYLKPESRLVGDATNAVIYAWAKMRTGHYRVGLVLAHAKESHGNPHTITSAAFDPFTERRLEPDADVVLGLAAQRFHASSGRSAKEAAAAVVRARQVGARNAKLEALDAVDVDDVLGSPLLASPLRQLDVAPRTDGATALVVATPEGADGPQPRAGVDHRSGRGHRRVLARPRPGAHRRAGARAGPRHAAGRVGRRRGRRGRALRAVRLPDAAVRPGVRAGARTPTSSTPRAGGWPATRRSSPA